MNAYKPLSGLREQRTPTARLVERWRAGHEYLARPEPAFFEGGQDAYEAYRYQRSDLARNLRSVAEELTFRGLTPNSDGSVTGEEPAWWATALATDAAARQRYGW